MENAYEPWETGTCGYKINQLFNEYKLKQTTTREIIDEKRAEDAGGSADSITDQVLASITKPEKKMDLPPEVQETMDENDYDMMVRAATEIRKKYSECTMT